MSVRILIADDHGIVRKGLRALLQSKRGWEICAEVSNGRQAVERARALKPDIAILDISMPQLNGVEALRQIRKVSPHTETLILSMHRSEKLVREAIDAGARGYLAKDDADDNLIAAVEALRHHQPYFNSKIVMAAASANAVEDSKSLRSTLTPRQREIIQLLAEGKSNKEVATILKISVKTAETHRANIMMRLDLHSFADLMHYAIRNDIIQR
jgi:DNA-binding NarL/FixJ family response regulator